MPNVAKESKRRKLEVSPGKAIREMVVKKKALRPKAESGNAVAVPRWCGQLRAAVFKPAPDADELPTPVKKDRNDIVVTLMYPGPWSYATFA